MDDTRELLKRESDKLRYLPPREQNILRMLYGIERLPLPLAEVAAEFGVTPRTIKKYRDKALRMFGNVPFSLEQAAKDREEWERRVPYTGTIIEESLEDNRILNKFKIRKIRITEDESPADRWHIYTVEVSMKQIQEISRQLKPGKWYAHFWYSDRVIAVFKDKEFRFFYLDPESWSGAVEYGLSLGIPKEQLDFLIE